MFVPQEENVQFNGTEGDPDPAVSRPGFCIRFGGVGAALAPGGPTAPIMNRTRAAVNMDCNARFMWWVSLSVESESGKNVNRGVGI